VPTETSVDAARGVVPPGGLLLHIGPHKTGTTAVQSAFHAAREQLAALGVTYPGPQAAPHGAVLARLGINRGWNDAIPPGPRRMWHRLCAQTSPAATSNTVVVSSESLCHAGPRQATAICEELRPGPVTVVITLRPLADVLPSAWQEYVKSGWTVGYDEFLQSVLRDRPAADGPTPTFWQRHAHGRLVRRWSSVVGADSVVVIVADPQDPDLVLDAFENLLGLPEHTLIADAGPINRSLRAAEIEFVRAVNAEAHRSVPWEVFNALQREGGNLALVEGRVPRAAEAPIGLPTWAGEVAAEYGRASITEIRRHGVRIIGDLETLGSPGRATGVDTPMPDHVDSEAVRVYAGGVVAAVRRGLARNPDLSVDEDLLARLAADIDAMSGDRAIVDAARRLGELLVVGSSAVPR
jgi:hypothetical protein